MQAIGQYFSIIRDEQKKKWFRTSQAVSKRCLPSTELAADSYAFDMLFEKVNEQADPSKLGAEAWLDRYDADRFGMSEHLFRLPAKKVVTLLFIEYADMLT